ncbi:hypothetical protein ACP70R_020461 [Stipagrostis hirtigluma subsp. patula]
MAGDRRLGATLQITIMVCLLAAAASVRARNPPLL